MKKVTLTVPWGQFDPTVKIPQHFVCEFLIILHIVSLSVGLTFTPDIGCTTISCALRTQSYCTHYRWIWFSCPLIWDKCHLTHLKTSERHCTSIPVILPLCYGPHVTEPHKRKKLSILHGRYYGVHLSLSRN